ncbi:MAG: hypothetical protein ACO3BV_05550, partial [Ilumatobacteraceae bacterium]
PDLAPENALGAEQLPRLDVVDPSGATTTVVPIARDVFAEPFTGTNYIRLADLIGTAVAGTYSVTISGGAPVRFTVSVGTKELFGTPVEDVPNRELGVAGVMTWYETPPPVVEAATPSTSTVSPTAENSSTNTDAPTTSEVEAPTASAGNETSQESEDGSLPPLVITVVAGVLLVGAVVARQRSRR